MVKGVSAEKEKIVKPWDHVKEETYFYRESTKVGDVGKTRTNDNNRISAIFQNPINSPVVPIVWRPSKEKEITAKPNAVRKEAEQSSSKLSVSRGS
jgi:hypothetical protein